MWLRKRSCWVCKVTTVVSVWLESVAAPYGILLLSPLFLTSLWKILLAFHTFQVLHHTACVTLNAGFKNQKHQRRESIWIRKAIVHFPLTLFPQRNVNLNKWIYRIIGAAVHSFFLSWCLVGLFPILPSLHLVNCYSTISLIFFHENGVLGIIFWKSLWCCFEKPLVY